MAASVHAARRPVNADLAHERSTLCYFTQAPHMTWDRLAEITGQFLSKGQLVDVEGRLQTRQWDDDAGKRNWRPSSQCEPRHMACAVGRTRISLSVTRCGRLTAKAMTPAMSSGGMAMSR